MVRPKYGPGLAPSGTGCWFTQLVNAGLVAKCSHTSLSVAPLIGASPGTSGSGPCTKEKRSSLGVAGPSTQRRSV